jgi:CBS domain-containing protein
MHLSNLSQLPMLTREKRMVGIVTLEDIARRPPDSSYPSRGAVSWQAPKADNNQSIG